jgi:hypothetical protein
MQQLRSNTQRRARQSHGYETGTKGHDYGPHHITKTTISAIAQEVEMHILTQKFPRATWHTDCPENKHKSGIVKEGLWDGDHLPVKCLHCGEEGLVLRGTPFDVEFCAEAPNIVTKP